MCWLWFQFPSDLHANVHAVRLTIALFGHNKFLFRGPSESMVRGLQGCLVLWKKTACILKHCIPWTVVVINFFSLEGWFRQRYLHRHFAENWDLNYHITQMKHVTSQTNFGQAPTKRPATSAAGPKTKKAKARVVRPEKMVASNGCQWLTVASVWSWFFQIFFAHLIHEIVV